MESANVKTIAYVLLVLALLVLGGLAVMKFNQASQAPPDTRTQAQKLHDLENSSAIQSPAAKRFLQNEKMRLGATAEAEKAVAEDH